MKPPLGFPANMQRMFRALHNGDTSVNAVHVEPSSFVLLAWKRPC
jgi:hypothetical protein